MCKPNPRGRMAPKPQQQPSRCTPIIKVFLGNREVPVKRGGLKGRNLTTDDKSLCVIPNAMQCSLGIFDDTRFPRGRDGVNERRRDCNTKKVGVRGGIDRLHRFNRFDRLYHEATENTWNFSQRRNGTKIRNVFLILNQFVINLMYYRSTRRYCLLPASRNRLRFSGLLRTFFSALSI